ncbi:MAG: N-6 DNA methylase [bacterium]|nr:N-6 DNA methylase [bacterium]
MNKDEAKLKIAELVKKYEQVIETRSISKYTEEETKKDFIQPLFHALGWDTQNKNEVTAEEHQQSGRPDYGFYLNGRCKFFVEAKALKTNLHNEEFANQAVRYSWNKGVTWAVLTDFESLKVFNAQVIDKSLFDKLFFEIKYTEYVDRFDQLWLLSKESFENNLLDVEGEKFGKKLQKISVSELLYKDLSECRSILTNDLGQWNKDVNKDLLDEGVQKLLDRLIFLRVAEDRGIEPQTLIPLIREWKEGSSKKHLYESMIEKFKELDEVYNSGLFSEHPFEKWEEYSGATEKVIKILYGKSGYYEYDFKAMPVDVLGGVYENYLGYRLAKSKKGLSIDKDATKRKEQGIYYTPDFIVDYIVKNTLKPVLDKCSSIEDLKKIKVLDPACGSGSFLLKALEVIHDKYIEFGSQGGTFTKIDILLNNIYGVDLDNQAVEIARLNLLISALDTRMKLPSLDKNIKNGNSLISGTDEELKKYFGKNYRDKKPFNWQEEFPEVFKQGGFDVIIGNPPWVFTREADFSLSEKNYFSNFLNQLGLIKTESGRNIQSGKVNLYSLFTLKATTLLNEKGIVGFIIPNNILRATNFDLLRKYLLDTTRIVRIVDLEEGVFKNVTASSVILFLEIESVQQKRESNVVKVITNGFLNEDSISQKQFSKNIKFTFNLFSSSDRNELSQKIDQDTVILGNICKYISPGIDGDKNKYVSKNKDNNSYKPLLFGKDFGRYSINYNNNWILYDRNKLNRARKEEIFLSDKIILQRISGGDKPLRATIDKDKYYTFNSVNNIILNSDLRFDIYYVLGLLNSSLINWYYSMNFSNRSKLTVNISKTYLEKLPIKIPTKNSLISSLVKKILELNNKLRVATENSEKWLSIKSEIEKVDKAIDQEVYKLYELNQNEINIIEKYND